MCLSGDGWGVAGLAARQESCSAAFGQAEEPTLDMVLVPAGDYVMGDVEMAGSCPAHTVFLDSFWIDRHEVTVARYKRFAQATGRAMPAPTVPTIWPGTSGSGAPTGSMRSTIAAVRVRIRPGPNRASPRCSGHPPVPPFPPTRATTRWDSAVCGAAGDVLAEWCGDALGVTLLPPRT